MYNINLLRKTLASARMKQRIVNLLKRFSLFLTFVFFGVCALSAVKFLETESAAERINKLKKNIEEERRINEVENAESEWETKYYELLAIQDIITTNTEMGLLLRDVGFFMPEGNKILRFEMTPRQITKEVVLVRTFAKGEKYDFEAHARELRSSYQFISDLIDGHIDVLVQQPVSVKGQMLNTVKIVIPLKDTEIYSGE
ncbi:MAG: hypothetical protein FWF32_01355 [Endomicrobia bacterium]|nr:hypothetical protein [Endomicrobiia bacterium]